MFTSDRTEKNVFEELEVLCKQKGYAHALAELCLRDASIKFTGTFSTSDIEDKFDFRTLIRSEINCLIGLFIKGEMDLTQPSQEDIHSWVKKTEELLHELHMSVAAPLFESGALNSRGPAEIYQQSRPSKGSILREGILYGCESAYYFQYREMLYGKFAKDSEWFKTNKGYDLSELHDTLNTISSIRNRKASEYLKNRNENESTLHSFLPELIIKPSEISLESGVQKDKVRNILDSFTLNNQNDSSNSAYNSIDDFNISNAYPFICLGDDNYLLFLNDTLYEACYETPFFWLHDDKPYRPTAMTNRGEFTEQYSTQCFTKVFGRENVYQNINIYDSKDIVGEIDTLILYAGRAIIVQAKSKKLTINARKGNDTALADDFKKAIQNAYDQGYSCGQLLKSNKFKLRKEDGSDINLNSPLNEIFIFCVVSEHYPALEFQAREFLNIKKDDIIKFPFVTGIFTLDIICELLNSPLYFLSYISQRSAYNLQIVSSSETAVLGYHLSHNLWIDENEKDSVIVIDNKFAACIDVSMYSRRLNLPGEKTPKGILTKYNNTFYERVIDTLNQINETNAYNLGLFLLMVNEDYAEKLNVHASQSINKTITDGNHHDMTLLNDEFGLIIHSNMNDTKEALTYLRAHCSASKYRAQRDLFYGLFLSCQKNVPSALVILNEPWHYSIEGENTSQEFFKKKNQPHCVSAKISRNAPCPCNSGKKYKKCCLKN